MSIPSAIAALHGEMTAWRRDLHAHPETAYQEARTADFIAARLASWGIEVHRGLAGTGVVGRLTGRPGSRTIGLRADMDALAMTEATGLPWAAKRPGAFHGCGHDGHMAMLLGAARYLAETRDFAGTAHLVFQPAEEGQHGARKMIEEGLFDRFPCDEIYAMHNWPDLPRGHVAVNPGPMMASSDAFEIVFRGDGGHGAMPHLCNDPVIVAAHAITALQALVSRQTDPLDAAVVSVTRLDAGTAFNVIPAEARIMGTVRALRPETRDALEAGLGRVARGVAAAFGAEADVRYARGYPPTVNHPTQAGLAAAVAEEIVGGSRVHRDRPPSMGAEDFSYMLQARPGAYLWLGQGGGGTPCSLHNPRYDFDDALLPIGASLFARLVERRLC